MTRVHPRVVGEKTLAGGSPKVTDPELSQYQPLAGPNRLGLYIPKSSRYNPMASTPVDDHDSPEAAVHYAVNNALDQLQVHRRVHVDRSGIAVVLAGRTERQHRNYQHPDPSSSCYLSPLPR
jgi:hypothetical protein